jgi:uncharacterized repeat protein (TIGR03803 family)
LRPATAALAVAIVLAPAAAAPPAAQAQTYTVIHNFTGGIDGADPQAGLAMDRAGNFYGTTNGGGAKDLGAVFKLKYHGSAWVLSTLYSFGEVEFDGADPQGRVSIAADGTLYGTTITGESNVGTVFHLIPGAAAPKSALAAWNETILHKFSEQGIDGQEPQGDLLFDQSGNIYGTTFFGGGHGNGVIYELTPSNGSWTENILYAARNNGDGMEARGGVISDAAGNLYGVFGYGGPDGRGAVYELSPSGSGWTEQTVYGFTGGTDGEFPFGGLIMDSAGNLYGTTSSSGSGGGGTVFELTPTNGAWTFNLLYSFSGENYDGPLDKLVMDAASNLYGTTSGEGAFGYGSVFKLTPSNGGWTYSSLHDFSGGSDGRYPVCSLVLDASGNLYGTASAGGQYDSGTVWEITP